VKADLHCASRRSRADDRQTGSQLLLAALALKTVEMSARHKRFAELHSPVSSGSRLMEARRFHLSPRFDRLLCEVLVSAGRMAKQPRESLNICVLRYETAF
jgi:hypothetical protein